MYYLYIKQHNITNKANRGNHNLGGWNRGLTINNPIIAANIKAMADATRGKKKPLEQRRKMSIAQKKRWAKTL
jgi:hypothetical protein